ncbi:MAG TPA: tyrosine-type recombinase/integrase [Steroidobacteraceae bacterium]
MFQSATGLLRRYRTDGSCVWHIDKRVRRYGRLCESTGTSDREEAERYLLHRLRELREIRVYGERPQRTFRDALRRYLAENSAKKSIDRDAAILNDLDSFIGNIPLDRINNDSFSRYRMARRELSARTRYQKIALARRVLRLAATVWCFAGTNLTWLERTPEILLESGHRGRQPYPLDEREQALLFSELPPHAAEMAAFVVNTGVRDGELCQLRWSWERHVSAPEAPRGWRTVFALPPEVVKNGESRVIVLNDAAQAIVDRARGRNRRFVFVSPRRRTPLGHLRSAGWHRARSRAADRYREWFGMEAPTGFRTVRVHDLRHTFGRKLRAAGVSIEDRRDLLGHKGPDITTHYSAPEIGRLVEAVNRISGSRVTSTPTLRRMIESARKSLVEREGIEPSTPAL